MKDIWAVEGGGLAERFKALVSKTSWGEILSQVQILHPPPARFMFNLFKQSKKSPENLKEILGKLSDLEGKFENLSGQLSEMKKNGVFNVQKIGIVRFNPFSEVGSDQSFSLAFLDGQDSGVVITSLYTREDNRVYGKPIKNGQSEYQLSNEEKEAINIAKNGKSI
jgi:hypothetical protein